MVKLKN